MPKPHDGETHDDFMDRCMADDEAMQDYPESDQRFAVCQSLWEQHKMTAADILKSIGPDKRTGIVTAAPFFRSIETCFDGGFCPTKLFGAASQDRWSQALKDAESSLVYCAPDLEVKTHDGTDIAPGSCLEFDHVITSTRKDRDGDILESSGAQLDPHASLLWQHIPIQPIGKFLRETGRTKDMVQGRSAIVDNDFGRDAAQLVEMGALRISHGFHPKEFEPLKGGDGWHVKEFEIVEVSLVSVPSNVDAVITAFSRNKLHTPLFKGWAKQHYDARPVQGRGIGDGQKTLFPETVTFNDGTAYALTPANQADADKQEEKKACACQKSDKAADLPGIKGYYGTSLPGSFEGVRDQLHAELHGHLRDSGVVSGTDFFAFIAGTYPDFAIVCVETMDGIDKYKIAWQMQDGKAKWTSEPTPVEIEIEVEIVEAKKRDSRPKTFGEIRKEFEALLMDQDIDTVNEVHVSLGRYLRAWQLEAERRAYDEAFAGILS